MDTIETLVRAINKEVVPRFERELRARLAGRSPEWLIEQIVRLTLDVGSLEEIDRTRAQETERRRRTERVARVKALGLDAGALGRFSRAYGRADRRSLMRSGHLKTGAPAKGGPSIAPRFRTRKGERLLCRAKDVLFACLFGDRVVKVALVRVQRELLTLTIPRAKAEALGFMQATTEISAAGTWKDPQGKAHDARADNVVMEIEFGEVREELVSRAVVVALSLVNTLEVNEQVLYGRIENIEQSTLIS